MEVGREDRQQLFLVQYFGLLFQLLNRKSIFAVRIQVSTPLITSGLLHLTDPPYFKKGRFS
jgi:hypothetical protein